MKLPIISCLANRNDRGKVASVDNYIKHRVGKEWFVESLNTFFYWLPAFLALIEKPLAGRDSITPTQIDAL